ncbi:MAG: PxxKW family cysteine-rich protein [Syntrophobacteraceae bacterium]
MVCSTMKAGAECAFMSKTGCGYNGGTCHQIVEQCEGCQRTVEFTAGKFCSSYPNPSIKWRASTCNFATHTKVELQDRQKINPLKASKRNNKKK